MKYTKILHILAIGIIVCLLVITLPATPVLAQTILLSPISGTAGSTVSVTGTGFTAYVGQIVYVLFNYNYVASATVIAGGTFTTSLTVPTAYATGMTVPVTIQHTTATYDATKQIAMTYFIVTARKITISPSSGYVGSTVTVSGSGFNPSRNVTIYFDTRTVRNITANSAGAFSGATFTVPDSYRGTHSVKGRDTSGNSPGVNFRTIQKITVIPDSGSVGDTITVEGTGFASSLSISFYFNDQSISAGTTSTTTNGIFTNNNFTIPPSSRGSYTIKAQDASANYSTAMFNVAEKVIITPESGSSGTTVTVSGSGFSVNKTITIKYNDAVVATSPATITTDTKGSFTGSFDVPVGLAGTYPVEATDGIYTAIVDFTAMVEATISQMTSTASPGYVGMELTITGNGFKPNALITITYTTDPVTLTTVNTDDNGAFSVTVTIPPSIGGNHIITVTDNNTTKQFTFVMESEAPPMSILLIPKSGVKVKSEINFDWVDAVDPSGVTYTLWITSDPDLTTTVLKKAGITNSEYTLTEGDELELVSRDEPYYWSVKVVDGASNESQWAPQRSFYAGSLFAMSTWAIYFLVGLGVILLCVLIYWLGKRSVQYKKS